MKRMICLVTGFFLISRMAVAKDRHFFAKGTLAEMTSVECGYEEKGAKGIGGVLLGTDSQHTKTAEMLCQEYTLKTDSVVYRIRPKDDKHPALLPVGQQAEFWIGKDRMHLRVPEGDDKVREYWVVSMTPRADAPGSKPSNTTASSKQ